MSKRHEAGMEAWMAAVLAEGGAVEAAVARAAAGDGQVPDVAAGYVDKLRRWAYKVTDEEVAALKAAGWSEPQIFELSVAAASGQGMRRYRAGMAALDAAKRGGR
jgi:hypothetical protein